MLLFSALWWPIPAARGTANSSRRSAPISPAKRATMCRWISSGPSTGSARARNRAIPSPAFSRNWAKRRRQLDFYRPMQAFLEYVVKGLVDHPEAATVTPVVKDALTIYELRLHPDDVGKIIGRQGMTINALRSLLLAGSAKKSLRCSLEIVEDNPATKA